MDWMPARKQDLDLVFIEPIEKLWALTIDSELKPPQDTDLSIIKSLPFLAKRKPREDEQNASSAVEMTRQWLLETLRREEQKLYRFKSDYNSIQQSIAADWASIVTFSNRDNIIWRAVRNVSTTAEWKLGRKGPLQIEHLGFNVDD
jgi:hypothetical protein